MPHSVIRTIEPKEIGTLPKSLHEWTSGFFELPGTTSLLASRAFDPKGCFVADNKGSIVGCVAVTNLPRKNWLAIRYLAAKQALTRVDAVERLLSRALEFVELRKPEFFRATTPSMQPYVDAYKSFGFKPIRRDFRITWDLKGPVESAGRQVEIRELDEKIREKAADVLVRGIRPYWDWRTEEQGGEDEERHRFFEEIKKGARWLTGSIKGQLVSLTGLIPNYYSKGEARFRGTFVVPEYRGKGVGRAMMNEGIAFAKKLDQFKMTVYTFSYLESLAPGALLYLNSGGKIESEYLQLQRAT